MRAEDAILYLSTVDFLLKSVNNKIKSLRDMRVGRGLPYGQLFHGERRTLN